MVTIGSAYHAPGRLTPGQDPANMLRNALITFSFLFDETCAPALATHTNMSTASDTRFRLQKLRRIFQLLLVDWMASRRGHTRYMHLRREILKPVADYFWQ